MIYVPLAKICRNTSYICSKSSIVEKEWPKLKPEKCQFAVQSVNYLGHVISKDGISVDLSKTEAVKSFPVPKNVTDVRAFLGLCNYYRKFVKDFAFIAGPLTTLLKKCVKFKWTDKCQEAFDRLKQALTSPPILVFPDFNKPFLLYCDASNISITFISGQYDSIRNEHVIAYVAGHCDGVKEGGLQQTEKAWP